TRSSIYYNIATAATHSRCWNEVVPHLITVKRTDESCELTSGCLFDLVRHHRVNFKFAFVLSLTNTCANRAGQGDGLQVFQFLFVADGGAGLFEYLLGLSFGVWRLRQRDGRDCNGGDYCQNQFAHFQFSWKFRQSASLPRDYGKETPGAPNLSRSP